VIVLNEHHLRRILQRYLRILPSYEDAYLSVKMRLTLGQYNCRQWVRQLRLLKLAASITVMNGEQHVELKP
jgi:hypothetical protein